jgi:site-specific DNA-methyltransferase (adenine-specific)
VKIIEKKVEELIPYINNPRNNEAAVDFVAASIKEFGFKNPIIIDKDGVIVAGHTRHAAAKKLGLETVPCIMADDLSEQQIKAFRLADNKTAEFATWDLEKLEIELESIGDLEMEEFGFESFENESESVPEMPEDELPDVPEEPKSKLGDIFKLGEHRLICGDSTDSKVIDRLMDGVKADMWLSDPPYNAGIVGGSHAIFASERKKQGKLTIQNDCMSGDEFKEFLTNAFTTAYTVLKGGASFYIWYTSREVVNFQNSLKESGFLVKQELIWNKSSLVMCRQDYQQKHEPCLYGWKDGNSHNWYGDRKQTTIIDFERPSKSDLHPTMKPIGLLAIQIKNSSKTDDIIFDGFGGSGSTLIACEQLNRKCYMAELDPKYVDVIIERWENFTGNKAEKIDS